MNILDFTKDSAKKAGEIVKNYYGKAKSFEKRGVMNYVTEADLAADKFIKHTINKQFPGHQILSEEDEIHDLKKYPDHWIIDPLDGTTNFKFQIPFFAISLAYLKDGEVKVGAVYDPVHDELYWANKGKGAFLNNQKLKIDDSVNLSSAVLGHDGHYEKGGSKNLLAIDDKLDDLGTTVRHLGSAVLDLCFVSVNRFNLYFHDGLKPWDLAAAYLIIKEAGGEVKYQDGKEVDILNTNQLIIAGSPHLLSEFSKIIY